MTIDIGNLRIQQDTGTNAASTPDLGLLSKLLGNWSGHGFNAIWRPNGGGQEGDSRDFFLEVDTTHETLQFAEVKGGIVNRVNSKDTPDAQLRAVSYLQQIHDLRKRDHDNQPLSLHVEPGFWLHIPPTSYPANGETVVRQALIPHGVSLLAQGLSMPIPDVDQLTFPLYAPALPSDWPPQYKSPLMPFTVATRAPGNNPDEDKRNNEEGSYAATLNFSNKNGDGLRTKMADLVDDVKNSDEVQKLQNWVFDPHVVLREAYDAIKGKITDITQLQVGIMIPPIGTDQYPTAPPLDRLQCQYGGGIPSIAFLLGDGHAPNAQPTQFEATFYIEEFEETVNGVTKPHFQLQYTQRVLLNFAGFLWPHISVANLLKQP